MKGCSHGAPNVPGKAVAQRLWEPEPFAWDLEQGRRRGRAGSRPSVCPPPGVHPQPQREVSVGFSSLVAVAPGPQPFQEPTGRAVP